MDTLCPRNLDGLRGVAIISVMLYHFYRYVAAGGWLGVDIFFVLSGYLITSILVAEHAETGGINYRKFIARRARRLLPALAALLIFCVIAWDWIAPQAPPMVPSVLAAAFYVSNFWGMAVQHETPLSHTWSLSIEEQFYLLWPFAMLGLLKLSRSSAAKALLTVWAFLTLARIGIDIAWPLSKAAYFSTPLHATGLLLGAGLALKPMERRWNGSIAIAILFALIVGGVDAIPFTFLIPIAELAAAVVILNPPNLLGAGWLRWLGRISYGVYLWHIPVLWMAYGTSPFFLIGASVTLGALSYYLVEPWTMGRYKFLLRQPAEAEQGS